VADGQETRRTGGLSDATARLGGTIVALLRSRLELASVEFEEERERATELLVLVLSGVLLALFALLFASIFVIACFWDTNRLVAIAGVTLFYVVLAAIVILRLQRRRRDKTTPFAATLAEFGQDVAALRREP
jgi:uncharacterized membrane protein YqjE